MLSAEQLQVVAYRTEDWELFCPTCFHNHTADPCLPVTQYELGECESQEQDSEAEALMDEHGPYEWDYAHSLHWDDDEGRWRPPTEAEHAALDTARQTGYLFEDGFFLADEDAGVQVCANCNGKLL